MDFGAISRDFERKNLRPRKISKIFGPDCAEKKHATEHAAASSCPAELAGTLDDVLEPMRRGTVRIWARSPVSSGQNFGRRENVSKIEGFRFKDMQPGREFSSEMYEREEGATA